MWRVPIQASKIQRSGIRCASAGRLPWQTLVQVPRGWGRTIGAIGHVDRKSFGASRGPRGKCGPAQGQRGQARGPRPPRVATDVSTIGHRHRPRTDAQFGDGSDRSPGGFGAMRDTSSRKIATSKGGCRRVRCAVALRQRAYRLQFGPGWTRASLTSSAPVAAPVQEDPSAPPPGRSGAQTACQHRWRNVSGGASGSSASSHIGRPGRDCAA